MRAVDVIRKKRDGGELTAEEIRGFVDAAARGGWPDYQLSALLMAIFLRGMTPTETATLTRAMADSGKILDLSDLPGIKVDKHSTGGVGDKVSLILAPLVAACGVTVPMMSGRGLGHTGGTLDKLEAIPGFRVNLSEAEFRLALKTVGCGMIGQSADVAPADKTLYALRDVTGTVESIPLITASILSKKIAEGISALVMDVKCGSGAFMKTLPEARALAESIQRVGTANGLKVETLITNMDAPLGRAVGHSLEVVESIETLKGHGPADLTELCVLQAAKMVRLAGLATTHGEAHARVQQALKSGAALDKFRQMVSQQDGDCQVVDDPSKLPLAPHTAPILANASGYIQDMDALAVGLAALRLGAGRERVEDRIDPAVGVIVCKKPGEAVRAGDKVFEIHHHGGSGLAAAVDQLSLCFHISSTCPVPSLILETLS
jgi:pyrimidine-nucleoside phosphorylase